MCTSSYMYTSYLYTLFSFISLPRALLCDDRKILQLLLNLSKDEQKSTLNCPSISRQGGRGRPTGTDFTTCQVKYSLVQSNYLRVLLHIKCSITSVYMKGHDLHQNHYMPIFKEFGRKSKCQLV